MAFFRHPGEGRDPVLLSLCRTSGFRPSPEWRFFTGVSRFIVQSLRVPRSSCFTAGKCLRSPQNPNRV